jgi:hypothetical protein
MPPSGESQRQVIVALLDRPPVGIGTVNTPAGSS